MSAATWRQFFTYGAFLKYLLLALIDCNIRYNKYTQIAARAVRQSLKENERVVAEKRGLTALRYQHWEGGKGGEQVAVFIPSRYILSCLANAWGRLGTGASKSAS